MQDPESNSKTFRVTDVAIVPVLLLALLIRAWGLGDASIWIDESFTIVTSSLPISTLWISGYDPTPPLFYTIEKFVLLFGDDEFLIRMPSVIFNVATVYVMYVAARLTVGLKGAIAVAIVLTLSTANIEYAQEARAYALLSLMVSLAFLGLVRLYQVFDGFDKRVTLGVFLKRGGLLYALAALGALYTHNAAVFFVFGVQVFFASLFMFRRDAFVGLARYWVLTNLAVFICWIPWIVASIEASKLGFINWLQHASIGEAIYTLRAVHGLHYIPAAQPIVDLTMASLILAGLYFLKGRSPVLALCFSLLISASLLTWLFGFMQPVFMVRTILWGALVSAFLVGVSFSRMKTPLYILALAAMTIVSMKNVANFRELNQTENEDWKGAARYFKENAGPAETIVLCADYTRHVFSYYIGKSKLENMRIFGWSADLQVLREGRVPSTDGGRPNIVWLKKNADLDMLQAQNRLWIFRCHCDPVEVAPVVERAKDLGLVERQRSKFKSIDILVYEKN